MSRSDPALSADVEAALTARIQAALNDARRLQAVHDSRLLDSPPEAVFDSLTALAALLLGVPVAFVSVMAADRDFTRASTASAASWRDLRAERAHLLPPPLLRDAPLVIDDTLLDPVVRRGADGADAGRCAPYGRAAAPPGAGDRQPVRDRHETFWGPNEVEVLVAAGRPRCNRLDLREALERTRVPGTGARSWSRRSHDLRAPLQVLSMALEMIGRAGAGEPPRRTPSACAIRSTRCSAWPTSWSAPRAPAGRPRCPAGAPRRRSRARCGGADDATDRRAARARPVGGDAEVMAVQVDYGRMLRVLTNLIGNAVKHCPAAASGSGWPARRAGPPGDAAALHTSTSATTAPASTRRTALAPVRARLAGRRGPVPRGWRRPRSGHRARHRRGPGGRVDLLDAPGRGPACRSGCRCAGLARWHNRPSRPLAVAPRCRTRRCHDLCR